MAEAAGTGDLQYEPFDTLRDVTIHDQIRTATPDEERGAREAFLVGRVIDSGRRSAAVYIETPPEGITVKNQYGEVTTDENSIVFGPGSQNRGYGKKESGAPQYIIYQNTTGARHNVPIDNADGHITEAVGFIPAEEITYPTVDGKATIHTERIKVENPLTGEEEPGVYFDYAWRPRGEYTHYGSRDNDFATRVLLPQSVASDLRGAIEQNPMFAREVARDVMVRAAGFPQDSLKSMGDIYGATEQQLTMIEPSTEVAGHYSARPIGSAH